MMKLFSSIDEGFDEVLFLNLLPQSMGVKNTTMKTGLLFTGGEQANLRTIKNIIKTKEDFFLIAADSGLETTDKLGLMPDLILGDMDSIKNKNLLEKYSSAETKIFPVEKDFTDTELGFKYAIEKNCKAIYIFGAGGGRTDHLLYFTRLFDEHIPPVLWISKYSLCFCIGEYCMYKELKIDLPKEASISIFSIKKDKHSKICADGLFWDISGINWQKGLSMSNKPNRNIVKTGNSQLSSVHLTVKKGRFLVFISPVKNYNYALQ